MTCTQCRGCMVMERCIEMRDDTGQLEFQGWRCLNCGDVNDGAVLRHRGYQGASPYQSSQRWSRGLPREWRGRSQNRMRRRSLDLLSASCSPAVPHAGSRVLSCDMVSR